MTGRSVRKIPEGVCHLVCDVIVRHMDGEYLLMRLMSEGYTSREIGEQVNASAKLVCARASKARKFLKSRPEIAQIAAAYHLGN